MTGSIEKLALNLGEALKQQELKLATAESCTAGGLSYWVTCIPGSSDWFDRGFVTYSNIAKVEMLGVNSATIETFGAVSEESVREMAEGALLKSRADVTIAITGVAGPSGGSKEKPVGTVWIAFAKRNAPVQTQKELFTGDRQEIRMRSIEKALEMALEHL